MLYAIDNYEVGKQRETSAAAAIHDYHRRFSSRFICPECNETVTLVDRINSIPYFRHGNRTETSPECDKRVDGHSTLTLYERVGLPLYLQKDLGNTYKLYMGFWALGEDPLMRAFENKALLSICNGDSWGRREYSLKITPTNFYPDQITLIPIDFFPANGHNYSLKYSAGSATSTIQRIWSDYADGFSYTGAVFAYSESGGKKIRRGDSISTDENYYVIAKQFSPSYSEINCRCVGSIYLNNQNFNVYIISVSASSQSPVQYRRVENYLRATFGLWLLEKKPEIITLWPPVVENDDLVPAFPTTKIFCSAISGNELPQVYIYNGSNVSTIPVRSDGEHNYTVSFQMYGTEAVVSIDRKYVGREIMFKRRSVCFPNNKYHVTVRDVNSIEYNSLELIPAQVIDKGLLLTSNAKLEIYRKSRDERYQHISIRNADALSLNDLKIYDTLLVYADSRILMNYSFEKPTVVYSDFDDMKIACELSKCAYGVTIPTPSWVRHYITIAQTCGYRKFCVNLHKITLNGKIPIIALKYLVSLKEAFGRV